MVSAAQGAGTLEQLLAFAVDLARRAGDLALRWFGASGLAVEHKSDGSLLTEADTAAERLLREEIGRRYPTDEIVGEEEGIQPGTSGRRWFVDPIDGTERFARGIPLFGTLVAVEDEDGAAVGVIHLPALGETVAAGRGLGCFCNGAAAHVSEHAELAGSSVSTSGLEYWTEPMLLGVRRAGCALRTWGVGPYGYALVATGRVEATVDPIAAPWDLAPGAVIIPEAGGRFTALDGREGIREGSGLATNGRIHDALLTVLAGASP